MSVIVRKIHDSVTPSIKSIIEALSTNGRNQVLLAAGHKFLEMTRANFGTTGEYRGKTWPSKKNGSPATLIKTGELRDSIKLGRPRNNFIDVYTTNTYAAAQAFGYKPNNLPARQFFPVINVGSPSYGRLPAKNQRELFTVISNKLTILSRGALPKITSIPSNQIIYGSPFTSPSNSGNK